MIDEFELLARDAERQRAERERLHPPPPPPPPPTPQELAAREEQRKQLKAERQRREREDAERVWRKTYLHDSGVPQIFRDKRFDTFRTETEQQRAAVAACREFVEQLSERYLAGEYASLWFLGPPGTGKTRIVSALVTVLHFEEGVTARLSTPARLIRRLRDTWGKGGKETERDVIDELAQLNVLVLDDVGTGWGGDKEIVQLTEVIDERNSRCNPTLITSNLDVDTLRLELGDRAFDRLRHGARVLPLTGPSYRRPA